MMQNMFLLTIFALMFCLDSISAIDTKNQDTTQCDNGWRYSSELKKCYKLDREKVGYFKAMDICKILNASIPCPTSQSESKALSDFAFNATNMGADNPIWLGAMKDNRTECASRWNSPDCWIKSDGTKLNFIKWGPGEPNGITYGQYCMDMNVPNNGLPMQGVWNNGDWNDWFCDQNPYIPRLDYTLCEKEPKKVMVKPVDPVKPIPDIKGGQCVSLCEESLKEIEKRMKEIMKGMLDDHMAKVSIELRG